MHTYLSIQQSYGKYFLTKITLKFSLQDTGWLQNYGNTKQCMKIHVFWKVCTHMQAHMYTNTHTQYYISSGWEDSCVFYSLQWLKETEVGK